MSKSLISFLTLTDNWLDRVWRDTEMSERNFLHQTPTSAEETNQRAVVVGGFQWESCGVRMIYTNIQIYRPKRPWQLEKYTKRPLTANTIGYPAAAWVSPEVLPTLHWNKTHLVIGPSYHITCKEYFQDTEQSKPASSMQKLLMSNSNPPERVVSALCSWAVQSRLIW